MQPNLLPKISITRGKSLLKTAYMIFVILKSHDFSVILVIFSDFSVILVIFCDFHDFSYDFSVIFL